MRKNQGGQAGWKNLLPHPLPPPEPIIWHHPTSLARLTPFATWQRMSQSTEKLGRPPGPYQVSYCCISLQP
jgi:hypothetical protein